MLADVEESPGEARELDFIALPANQESWIDDAPICQWSRCPDCGNGLRSWSKRMRCPVCLGETYGT